MKTEAEIRADMARLDRQRAESKGRCNALLEQLGAGVLYDGVKVSYQQALEIEEQLKHENSLQNKFLTRIFALDWVLNGAPLPGFSQEALLAQAEKDTESVVDHHKFRTLRSAVQLFQLMGSNGYIIPASLTYEDAWLMLLGMLTPAVQRGKGLQNAELIALLDQMLQYAAVTSKHLADPLREIRQVLGLADTSGPEPPA